MAQLRVEAGDVETKRRLMMAEQSGDEARVRNKLLLKELGELRTKLRMSTLEKDAFKQEAQASQREVERHKLERQELLVTVARLQDEVSRQSERADDAFLLRAAADIRMEDPSVAPVGGLDARVGGP